MGRIIAENGQVVDVKPLLPQDRYQPIGCLVAFYDYKAKETPGGIVLPDGCRGTIETPVGKVVAVGPECKQVKPGDEVLIHPGQLVHNCLYKGEVTRLIREEHIYGILREESGLNYYEDNSMS